LDTVDLHSIRVHRSKQLASLAKTALCCPSFDFEDFLQQQDGLWEREIAAVFRSDLVLVVSDFERDVLVRSFKVPQVNVQLCRLSYPHRDTAPLQYHERQGFVAIGSFRHPPNVDALSFLLDEFWPLLRNRLPHAELEIWGSHMTAGHARQMAKRPGVHVKGYAPCAREVLARARVHLALVRFGAGIKTKISDAFFSGTPTVTTPIGVEGMLDDAEFPGFVSGDLSEALEHAVWLHEDNSVWNEKAELTSTVLQKGYTAESTTIALGRRVDAIMERLPQHRSANPLGRVFWHQSCRSTEYFSKWIELKEKG
jgi:hypothetical protein